MTEWPIVEWLQHDFFWYAFGGALMVAILAGVLGCFVVWQGMSYFGAALAHTALLGVALGFFFNINIKFSVALTAMLMGLLLTWLRSVRALREQLHNDVLLGFLAHIAMALGIVVLVAMDDVRIDLFTYLFGDVLTINQQDLLFLMLTSLVGLCIVALILRPLLMMIVDEELAAIEGVNTTAIRLIFILLLAWVVALAMQVVGVLLVASFLIIPAASARRLSKTPLQMLIIAVVLAVIAVFLGVLVSFNWNIPAGPMMVMVMAAEFIILWLLPKR